MKFSLLLSLALFSGAIPLFSQNAEDSDADTPPPPGSTVITSTELHSDQTTHISVFTGNVLVVGTNFHMTCKEMTVIFTTGNKVDKLIAVGDVIITQPGRVTHCGRAEYQKDADTYILTDHPVIIEPKNQLSGTVITIDRKTQKMTTTGGRTKVIIEDQNLGGNSASTNSPTAAEPK